MVVLHLKNYICNSDILSIIMDTFLGALEENTNCQALYIQNYEKAMLDQQLLCLLGILRLRKCCILCLNIGETYKIFDVTWAKFAKGLKDTKVTHMYASQHRVP